MKAILLAIKPEYARKILSGEKTYEYRKRLAKQDVKEIYLCSQGKVVGKARIAACFSGNKEGLWNLTKRGAGIDKDTYMKYFGSNSEAHCYYLEDIEPLDKELSEFGIKKAPQAFKYIEVI